VKIALWLLILSVPVWARLGGGESYSAPSSSGYSSSSSSSSSSGGGDAQLIFFLLELIIRYPAVGVPVATVAFVFWMYSQRSGSASVIRGRSSPVYGPSVEVPDADIFHVRPQHDENLDANFSYYVFRDFVTLLFTQVQQGRTGDLAQVGHYLSPPVRKNLLQLTARQEVTEVRDVIVGAARILGQVRIQGQVRLTLTLETNYTEVRNDGPQRVYTKERWTFVRKAGVLSPGPRGVGDQRLGCPNCGQPGEVASDGRCPYCDKVVNQGDFGWVVGMIQVLERERQLNLGLGGHAPERGVPERGVPERGVPERGALERGTNLPTVRHPQLAQRLRTFRARYPNFEEAAFQARVRESFFALQEAWSQQEWMQARPYETDSLFQTHRYWIEAYQSQGVVNQLSQIECQSIELSNLETDAFFDAITVRVFASMIDVTRERKSGRILGGDADKPRQFSEYWTFIRKVGYQAGATKGARTCPSCGAPLDRINQAGQCEYCESVITRGDFDWVLAQIEQDESYRI